MNRRESWQDWHNRALRAMCLMNFDLTRLVILAVAAHSVLSGHAWFGAVVISVSLVIRFWLGFDHYAPRPRPDEDGERNDD